MDHYYNYAENKFYQNGLNRFFCRDSNRFSHYSAHQAVRVTLQKLLYKDKNVSFCFKSASFAAYQLICMFCSLV